MIPRSISFAHKKAKRKHDELLAVSLADRAAMRELTLDLTNEISDLRTEVEKLKAERNQLWCEVMWAMRIAASGGSGQHDSTSECKPLLEPTLVPCKPAWRKVDRKAQALESALKHHPSPPRPPPGPPPYDGGPHTTQPQPPILKPPERQTLSHHLPGLQIQSWSTWQPDPQLVPSPLSSEAIRLIVPPRESPGLFGPRSPCDSP